MSAHKAAAMAALTFSILIKKEGDLFIAHCLELDIVATANNPDQVERDILALVDAQVDYAFTHNNLNYFYHPAPPEVWKEFFECKYQVEKRNKIESQFKDDFPESFVPPWMVAMICKSFADHV